MRSLDHISPSQFKLGFLVKEDGGREKAIRSRDFWRWRVEHARVQKPHRLHLIANQHCRVDDSGYLLVENFRAKERKGGIARLDSRCFIERSKNGIVQICAAEKLVELIKLELRGKIGLLCL